MLTITGASDDLIEFDGEFREEWNVYLKDNESALLAISDGSLIRVTYDQDGIWRFVVAVPGRCTISKTEGDAVADTHDELVISGEPIKWVTLCRGNQYRIGKQ